MKIIYIDPEKCVSCKNCEIHCAIAHSESKDLAGSINESPLPVPRIKIISNKKINLPIHCRHCETPFCIIACPKDALKLKDGIVYLENDLCINCKACIKVCPFDAIKENENYEVIIKCDFCMNRKEGTACVEVCPTNALTLVDSDKIKETPFLRENAENSYLYPEGKIDLIEKMVKSSKPEIEKQETCKVCGEKISPLKKIEESRTKVKRQNLMDQFSLCYKCRKENILNNIKL